MTAETGGDEPKVVRPIRAAQLANAVDAALVEASQASQGRGPSTHPTARAPLSDRATVPEFCSGSRWCARRACLCRPYPTARIGARERAERSPTFLPAGPEVGRHGVSERFVDVGGRSEPPGDRGSLEDAVLLALPVGCPR